MQLDIIPFCPLEQFRISLTVGADKIQNIPHATPYTS
jgi:hypothetical protein